MRSARPRPFSDSRNDVTPGSSAASAAAMAGVASVLALSAIVMRKVYGQVRVEAAHRRLEVGLLVVDRDDDVEHDVGGRSGRRRGGQFGLRAVDAHVDQRRAGRCPGRVVDLCTSCACGPG